MSLGFSPHGIATIAGQEFRVRIRAGRWRILLAIWFIVLVALYSLAYVALMIADVSANDRGVPLFGILMMFVLGVMMLIVPALTSQSINGDRERGTLATMQVTLVTAADIAIGKLLAAWLTALVFLALTLPMIIWSMAAGGAPFFRVLVTFAIVAILLGVVCAISQGLSAIFVRSTTSSVISYLVVFVLTIGTLIAFGLATALVTEEYTQPAQTTPAETYPGSSYVDPATGETVEIPGYTSEAYTSEEYTYDRSRPDKVWGLLAPNPFVVLADAAPALPRVKAEYPPYELQPAEGDVLGAIGSAVRSATLSPDDQNRYNGYFLSSEAEDANQVDPAPVWTWGLGINVLIGLAFLLVTIRKLQTPSKRLGRGVRVA